jgi:hypothetical protein
MLPSKRTRTLVLVVPRPTMRPRRHFNFEPVEYATITRDPTVIASLGRENWIGSTGRSALGNLSAIRGWCHSLLSGTGRSVVLFADLNHFVGRPST